MSGYWTGILSILAVNVVFAYGVFLPVATGQLNLGGAGFQAVGAYAAAYLSATYAAPALVTIPVGMAAAGLVGFLIAWPILRTRGVYLVLATFAFAEVVVGVILNTPALGGPMGLSVPDFVDAKVPLAAALVVTLAVFLLMTTRFGLAMRAVHDDETVSDLMGVSVRGIRVAAMAIGGALAGLSGALYALSFGFVDVHAFGSAASIYVLLFVLLGGTQTAWGPLVGAAFFTLLPELLRPVLLGLSGLVAGVLGTGARAPDDSWRFVILGLVTIAMMATRPEGLVTRTLVEQFRLFRGRPRAAA
jgi:branched-chain amino acid transport system permease protein